jgi:hypothetical protein
MIHQLKIWPEPFAAVLSGTKPFEVRVNDRGFKVDDVLVLEEWDPASGKHVGPWAARKVTSIVQGQFGLPPKICVMGLALAKVKQHVCPSCDGLGLVHGLSYPLETCGTCYGSKRCYKE